MPIYYPMGTALVTLDELLEKSATGQLKKFKEALVAEPKKASINFSTGQAEGTAIFKNLKLSPEAPAVPFVEVGLHKPLTLQLRYVYTGKSPDGKDMLLSSAIKGMTTYEGAPRAVNLLARGVKTNAAFEGVPAHEMGTFLVFYSPAILETQANLHLEIGFDKFPQDLFDSIGSALASAGKIPIFAAVSGILVAAGAITKLFAKVAEALIDDDPFFQEDETIHIFQPGAQIPEPGFRLITTKHFPKDELKEYRYDSGILLDKTNMAYSGPHPYIVISLDGRPNDDYKSFTATAATTALIERFYKVKQGSDTAIPAFVEALELFNDLRFRSQALAVAKELKDPKDKESGEYKERKARFDSLVKSILHEELRPSLES